MNASVTAGPDIDLEKAKLEPASVFDTPQDVLTASGLTPEEKIAVLTRWEADAEALLRATEEGMPPQNRDPSELLRAVHLALQALEASKSAR